MKKLLLTITALIFSLSIYSQGNLQFNNTVNYTKFLNLGSTTGNASDGHGVADQIIVPEGKIWKITSVFMARRDTSRNNSIYKRSEGTAKLNEIPIYVPGGSSDTNTVGQAISFPIWLSSGTYELYVYNADRAVISINALEFNVVN